MIRISRHRRQPDRRRPRCAPVCTAILWARRARRCPARPARTAVCRGAAATRWRRWTRHAPLRRRRRRGRALRRHATTVAPPSRVSRAHRRTHPESRSTALARGGSAATLPDLAAGQTAAPSKPDAQARSRLPSSMGDQPAVGALNAPLPPDRHPRPPPPDDAPPTAAPLCRRARRPTGRRQRPDSSSIPGTAARPRSTAGPPRAAAAVAAGSPPGNPRRGCAGLVGGAGRRPTVHPRPRRRRPGPGMVNRLPPRSAPAAVHLTGRRMRCDTAVAMAPAARLQLRRICAWRTPPRVC